LIIGLQRSAIGTLVERTTRFTMLIHLPREVGYGIIRALRTSRARWLPCRNDEERARLDDHHRAQQLRRSLTWDRGKELSQHAQFKVETGVPVFFADSQSPWQRGTNENTNGLLRQYFPKGTDLARWSHDEIQSVANALNGRPRKTLGWKAPAEAFDEQLRLLQLTDGATTG
jgi:IS30 family transposase